MNRDVVCKTFFCFQSCEHTLDMSRVEKCSYFVQRFRLSPLDHHKREAWISHFNKTSLLQIVFKHFVNIANSNTNHNAKTPIWICAWSHLADAFFSSKWLLIPWGFKPALIQLPVLNFNLHLLFKEHKAVLNHLYVSVVVRAYRVGYRSIELMHWEVWSSWCSADGCVLH